MLRDTPRHIDATRSKPNRPQFSKSGCQYRHTSSGGCLDDWHGNSMRRLWEWPCSTSL